ncbi:ABC transporter permease [Mesorhizobium sp. M7A.F.Ca.US.006.01.1.1]|uniref:ABC transporter permease n=1 Tax=Mesorhizobium sp. M7A.F.Ca.US.006.01.1.1 TaxID=2496707 RepID=UPI0013E2ABA5|nr:ABC transporter permease [Mesorhizobium sp. M7A.F.Ca.US.006.01.1.1]
MIPDRLVKYFAVYAACVCIFTILPVAAIIAQSFTANSYLAFPPSGFSLRWYEAILRRPEFLQSAQVSVVIAIAASILSTVLGTLVTFGLVHYDFFGKRLLQSLFMAPLSLPGLILGLALLQFFALRGLPRDLPVLIMAHVITTIPFAIRFVTVALAGMNPNLELAAQSLGADRWTTFRKVTFPLIKPGIVASVVFTFILSFDDVAVSLFLASPTTTTLPVRIYTYIDQNYDPLITAVSSLVVFAGFIALALIERIVGVGRLFGLRA